MISELFKGNVEVILMNTLENKKYRDEILAGYKDLLSVKDLSKIFEVSEQTIYKEIRDGKFGMPICVGRSFKVPRIYVLEKFFLSYR